MGKPTGFIELKRSKHPAAPGRRARAGLPRGLQAAPATQVLADQGARCMDCGIPFCHQGCPLGNLIPDWNDLVYRDHWQTAIDALHATNNFPEFTGRLCPAPCEASCVLGINADPSRSSRSRSDHRPRAGGRLGHAAAARGAHRQEGRGRRLGPVRPGRGRSAEPAGHPVTVFERADRIGGLLRYGIPDFKMEKRDPRSPARADGGGGRRLQAGLRRRRDAGRGRR